MRFLCMGFLPHALKLREECLQLFSIIFHAIIGGETFRVHDDEYKDRGCGTFRRKLFVQ